MAKYCVYKNNKCLTFVLRLADLAFFLGGGRTLKSGSDFVLESAFFMAGESDLKSESESSLGLPFFDAEEETCKRLKQSEPLEFT